ncbi:TPA: hypothetical protein ACPSKZ_000697 [Legionella anisa]|uniref:hypothetical protein n=1 Tax=Legionella anisa TaxID=28082 RepID=UPI002244CE96|nr:hypothetical protein [Legionella anisa]MCW8425605.1 hypothetical protein [Legionella anisa]MCW8448966.1 hypothetical protein [Legionella anisa]
MIISEKQIMRLIRIAEMAQQKFIERDWWHEEEMPKSINALLNEIYSQQSETLKLIE